MSKAEKRLTAKQVQNAKAGRHADGGGLHLEVDGEGRRRWIWRYHRNGKSREMGLGSAAAVTLAEARAERDRWRGVLADGRDPIDERGQLYETPVQLKTFGDEATAYLAEHEKGWRNAKHRAQWRMTLEVHARPLWRKPVAEVSTADILAVLKPIWQETPETASRLRGRIEAVLDAAQALGHVEEGRANPARWKGHLAKLLAKRQRLSRGHHAAMAFQSVPSFVATLREEESSGARAFEFLILTAARTSEVTGALWSEISFETQTWTIPPSRMKAGREHRVPLAERAVDILREMSSVYGAHEPTAPPLQTREISSHSQSTRNGEGKRASNHRDETGALIFPGLRPGRPLSNMVFAMALRRRGLKVTPHGFRSAFADWRGDATSFPKELAEAALAHTIGDKVEAAYRRSDALERRRELMDAWARFLDGETATVIPIRQTSP